jgi:hypothetical protein
VSTIASGVIVGLGILAAIPLFDLVFAQIECGVSPGGSETMRWKRRDAEQGQRSAERRGQPVLSVEKRARTAMGKRGEVEYLSAPDSAAGECGVMIELDDDAAVAVVIAERNRGSGCKCAFG